MAEGKKPVVIIEAHLKVWKAYFEYDPDKCAYGKTELDAIAQLHFAYPALLGVIKQCSMDEGEVLWTWEK